MAKQPVLTQKKQRKENKNNGEAQTPSPVYLPASKRLQHNTYEDIRKHLSKIANDVLQLKIDPVVAKAAIYAVNSIVPMIDKVLLEGDIAKLLEAVKEKQYGSRYSSSQMSRRYSLRRT